jgi:hypothetical protein
MAPEFGGLEFGQFSADEIYLVAEVLLEIFTTTIWSRKGSFYDEKVAANNNPS